jgi:hypothetical protein
LFFADELQESEKDAQLAHMPVKGRVSQALLSLKNKFGETPEGFIDTISTGKILPLLPALLMKQYLGS